MYLNATETCGVARFLCVRRLAVAGGCCQGRVHDTGIRADSRAGRARRRRALGAGRSVHDHVRHSHPLLPVRHAGLPGRTR